MKLIVDVDQYLDDFAVDATHDVLFERTPYVSYFTRKVKDLFTWGDYKDFMADLANENDDAHINGKHRFYRRLFMEPIVYHHEITEEEQDYVRRFYHKIEENIHKYTGYIYERYQHNSALIKTMVTKSEVLHPADNMRTNLILRFAGYILGNQADYAFSFTNEIDISNNEIQQILAHLKDKEGRFWSKGYKEMSSEQLRNVVVEYLVNWNFAEVKDDKTLTLKEGLFRIVGDYSNEERAKEER